MPKADAHFVAQLVASLFDPKICEAVIEIIEERKRSIVVEHLQEQGTP